MTEPDKNLSEALLRSHQATEQHNQEQSKLHGMSTGDTGQTEQPTPELNEKPSNLLRSWDTLRQLDEELGSKDHDPNP
jgi:hypothetical protein